MPIRLAFSTLSYPDLDLPRVVEKAQQLGFDGIELRTLGSGGGNSRAQTSPTLKSDPAAGDPAAHARLFEDAGIEPICLSTSHTLHDPDESTGARAISQVEYAIELADSLGCGRVRVMGHQVPEGEPVATTLRRMADRAAGLLETAGESGIELLYENGGALARARPWWEIANMIDHPLQGMLWNVVSAAAAGEGPAVWVPLLHSRLRIIRLRDAQSEAWTKPVPPGEGDCEIEHTIRRLCGIGFDGYLSLDYNRMIDPALPVADDYLTDARDRIRAWLDDIAAAKADPVGWGKKKAAAMRAAAKGGEADASKSEKPAAKAARKPAGKAADRAAAGKRSKQQSGDDSGGEAGRSSEASAEGGTSTDSANSGGAGVFKGSSGGTSGGKGAAKPVEKPSAASQSPSSQRENEA